MYIYNDGYTYYSTYGCQHRSRGRFLILLDYGKGKELRGIIRTVALHQLGHWMMGYARVYGQSVIVSGSYGNNGLPLHLDLKRVIDADGILQDTCQTWRDRVWESATPVPQELYDMWANGGGWNSAGSEAGAMRVWARGIDTMA